MDMREPRKDTVRLPEDRPLPNRALHVDRLLSLASEAGLHAAVTRLDLSPSELGLLDLLTEFRDDVPGAEAAAREFAERRQPDRAKHYRIVAGGVGGRR